MSETTPSVEELNEDVEIAVEDDSVVPTPIDPTLSNEGEAADAKATGDAIADVLNGLKVNEKSVSNKSVTIYGTDIKFNSDDGASTIAEKITSLEDRDADDVMYDAENLVSVKEKIDEIVDEMDTDLTEEEIVALYDEVMGEDDE